MLPQGNRKARRDRIRMLAERRTNRRITENVERTGEKYPELAEQIDKEFAAVQEARKAKEERRAKAAKAKEVKETK